MRKLLLLFIILTSCTKEYASRYEVSPAAEVCYIKDSNIEARATVSKQVNYDVTISKFSKYVVLLDFNGQIVKSTIWNTLYGDTINCTSSGLNASEIRIVIDSIRKDFVNFNIDLTTNESVYSRYERNKRIRLIITDNSFKPNVGGVSFTGSIKWGDETPAFVFSRTLNYNTKYIAETCSHEIGHTISLSHQVDCINGVYTNPYRIGTIMGNSLNTPGAYWGIGTIYTCEIVDEIAKINSFLQ